MPIFKYAPNCIDRRTALNRLMASSPSEATIQTVVDAYKADSAVIPVFNTMRPLMSLEKTPNLRAFYEAMLTHASFDRRAEAVSALAALPADPGTTAKLRALITDKDPIPVVVNAIRALAAWDKKANKDVFQKALKIPSHRDRIKSAAQTALED